MSRQTGAEVERRAARMLEKAGLVLLESNYYCRMGEIDIIALDASDMVFVEVKYRRLARYGRAEEQLGSHKQRRMLAAARHYLATYHQWQRYNYRFDLVAWTGEEMRWLKNVISI